MFQSNGLLIFCYGWQVEWVRTPVLNKPMYSLYETIWASGEEKPSQNREKQEVQT